MLTIGSLFRNLSKTKKKFISRLAQPSDGCFVKKFMQAGAPDGGGASSHLLTTHLAPLTVRAAVVLGRDGALHGPRGWAAGQCRCRERERWKNKATTKLIKDPRPVVHAAFPESRDDDWDVPLLTGWLTG